MSYTFSFKTPSKLFINEFPLIIQGEDINHIAFRIIFDKALEFSKGFISLTFITKEFNL